MLRNIIGPVFNFRNCVFFFLLFFLACFSKILFFLQGEWDFWKKKKKQKNGPVFGPVFNFTVYIYIYIWYSQIDYTVYGYSLFWGAIVYRVSAVWTPHHLEGLELFLWWQNKEGQRGQNNKKQIRARKKKKLTREYIYIYIHMGIFNTILSILGPAILLGIFCRFCPKMASTRHFPCRKDQILDLGGHFLPHKGHPRPKAFLQPPHFPAKKMLLGVSEAAHLAPRAWFLQKRSSIFTVGVLTCHCLLSGGICLSFVHFWFSLSLYLCLSFFFFSLSLSLSLSPGLFVSLSLSTSSREGHWDAGWDADKIFFKFSVSYAFVAGFPGILLA